MTYEAAIDFLMRLPRFEQAAAAYHPGLAVVERLLDHMGCPHQAFKSVHIAGTNGKGSTASMIAAIGTSGGYRMGLHTSPHLFDFAERMRVDGLAADHDWVAEAVARHERDISDLQPTFFEVSVALSFLYFACMDVDYAVVEVGMGGRLDATNVLHPEIAIITSIGLDHSEFLGNTLAEIAREKAGIIKRGVPVVSSIRQPDVLEVVRSVAGAQEATLHAIEDQTHVHRSRQIGGRQMIDASTPVQRYEGLEVSLGGKHQTDNAVLSIRAAELLWPELHENSQPIVEGLRATREFSGLAGRCDIVHVNPLVVADVAHNPDAVEAAIDFIDAYPVAKEASRYAIVGIMRDKDHPSILRLLSARGFTVLPITLSSQRALTVEELVAGLHSVGGTVGPVLDATEGLRWFYGHGHHDDVLLVTGSHLTVEAIGRQDMVIR